ncbi:DHH family phosphoesterase [Synoicihabitans lomoniglobus]|uniref:Bifunctional oligoribonuclease/PAP phosphatase NrnA n=1 Tax=Synoicihabitans lomoniglobus TaxID=2909285 RepID=A0AAF0CRG2_9BACT|nr:bifunctional oligoribonuclease/PAP phosphatase NrnA [Opitutaceae bacterium LMO-M01]WED66714.1 bifunctional oligoribonuclease/PAP phosphatase NrnA [Opitutaceae bacterium LMO-M01]
MTDNAFCPTLAPSFRALLDEIQGRCVAVVGHARPDGDCIGSQVALARVLRALGHQAICVNQDAVPRRLEFCARGESFINMDGLGQGEIIAIFVDCADHERAGKKPRERFAQPFANIDHHVSNVGYATHNCVDAKAAATCEILAGLFLDLDLPVDAATAKALYAGIVTDTGQFRFASTTGNTFRLVSELVSRGADPVEAGFELYEREPLGKMQLLQHFLASFEMHADGRICIGTIARGVFDQTGTSPEDTEGLVDYARAIDGVEIGCLIEEKEDGAKASLRANDPVFRVDQVASQFNGGGHACAAGLNFTGLTTAEFRQRLVQALITRLHEVDASKRN